MRFLIKITSLIAVILTIQTVYAEKPSDFAVRLSREITSNGSGKTTYKIHWENTAKTIGIAVYKKEIGGSMWLPIGQIDSIGIKKGIDSWPVDSEPMEYMVQRIFLPSLPFAIATNIQYDTVRQMMATGYIVIGEDRRLPDSHGTIALVIDSLVAKDISSQIDRLEQDLKSEWWKVARIIVPRAEKFSGVSVLKTKNAIEQLYEQEKNALKAAFLIGHVAVPYSGLIRPDGHPDHLGAWPADAYYGDMDGVWTDISANDSVSASRQANKNIPGDGKFDQNTIPSNIEVAIGRVDFYDMPAFHDSNKQESLYDTEIALLKRYFDKNHSFRSGNSLSIPRRALIDDNFGSYSPEMFASSGWRLASICDKDSIRTGKALNILKDSSYMWFYGCGGGSYVSCSGVAVTTDFAKQPIKSVFTSLFGSYFGDWDNTNNIMRALVAADGQTLVCSWSARPHWYFHCMGLGYTVGDAFLASINNDGSSSMYYPNVYFTQSFPNGIVYQAGQRGVHVALIGDPSLRMAMGGIPQASKLSISQPGTFTQLKWQPASDPNVQYIVFRADSTGKSKLLTDIPLQSTTSFNDSSVVRGKYHYSVYSVKLRNSPSASYYDANGIPIEGEVAVTGITEQIPINNEFTLDCSPHPIVNYANFQLNLPCSSAISILVSDISGNEVVNIKLPIMSNGNQKFTWDLNDASGQRVPAGIYSVNAKGCGASVSHAVVVLGK